MTLARFIAHFDIDAFYASVAIRDDPSLAGRPLAVAGSHRRSVVLTASYEARPYGVRSAIPLYRARELCPELVVVPPDMAKYKTISREVFAIFESHATMVEGLSMDEAFLDLGERSLEEAVDAARAIRADVLEATGLTVSGGVATGKLIAKIASDTCKPNGLLAVAPGDEEAFLAPLPAKNLWGIGPKTAARLETFGITTIGQIAALDDATVRALFGSWGLDVRELAKGIDRRAVEPDRETKSISSEETFEYDVRDESALREVLKAQALELAQKLEAEGLSACTIGIKIKRADFRIMGRQTNLSEPTSQARVIFRAAMHCLKRAELARTPVRLLGTRVASLVAGESKQQALF